MPRPLISPVYEQIICPWSPQHPRHDHQLIFPLKNDRLILVWSEYYANSPSTITRDQYEKSGSSHDGFPCRISAKISTDLGPTWTTLIKEQLAGRRFDIFLDMHEDYDATGTYFYEGQRDEKWLAPSIAQQAKEIGTLDDDVGENDIPLAEGVLQVDPAWAERGFTSYVYEHHTDHAIITETSSNWPLPKRVEVHLLALDMILNHYSE